MAAMPEEFLFVDPEPPSPSVFLDLPPTPHGDDEREMFDDMFLPYVSRLLMEEEDTDDSFFYQYPDHPALLQAQLPFAQILSDAAMAASDSSCTATSPSVSADTNSFHGGASSSESDHSGAPSPGFVVSGDGGDVVSSAFLKGMEEANKFLPSNNTLLLDVNPCSGEVTPTDDSKLRRGFTVKEEVVDGVFGGSAGSGSRKNRREDEDVQEVFEGRWASKLITPETEDAAAREMLDEMMLNDQDICMKGVEHLSISMGSCDGKGSGGKRQPRRRRRRPSDGDETVDLHTLLLHCAQAVASDDRRTAHELLVQIKQHASPLGNATQRVAHYFGEGLEARLAGTGSQLYRSLMLRRTSAVDFLRGQKLYMAACCCRKVSYTFSNRTICDAVAGRTRLHIVDYGLNYGFQWPGLLRGLAARAGGPPAVRITGIDFPQPGFRPGCHLEGTGRRLSRCAREFGVPFKFRGIAGRQESIRPEDLDLDPAEVLVVSSLCHFRHLMDESVVVGRPSPRDQVLGNIRRMRPDVFVHGVMNGAYGATFFPTRFREALFHYAAQFDLLDATVPRDSEERLLLERDFYGQAVLNVAACEGADRIERPETYKQWQARNRRAGLRQLPLKPEVVKVVLNKVRDNYHKDFIVDEDDRWLLNRWKGRVLYGLSTWVADNEGGTGP
ncbi:hypothetical protein ACP4OV_002138 [Aristida adscensionis]